MYVCMYVSTAIEKYCMMQRKELLVSLAWYLHFYMNNLDCLPDLERKFFEKQRRLREEQKAND